MRAYIGIDTSNYTTSAAAVFEDGHTFSVKVPLTVKAGEKGVRQSEALFMHTVNIPSAMEQLRHGLEGSELAAVGVSSRPRNIEGSYMPCFLAGVSAAHACAQMLGVPLYEFSHQDGHVMAAFCESGHVIDDTPDFVALHISGGTNDMLKVNWNKNLHITQLAASKDITAGQLVDRCGVMLGLNFPCGKELEKLALNADKLIKPHICVKDGQCNISGAENKCRELLEKGETRENIALYTLNFVHQTVDAMLEQSGLAKHLPVVFVGGVMSNSIIRNKLSEKYNCFFAKPEFSSDNACGIAELARRKYND